MVEFMLELNLDFKVQFDFTVSLNRIWSIDEMNPGNDYYSSPDLYLGN